ncbi:MAG: hypothetical protein V3S62_01285 [Acidimicrobiia bacterium]
MSLESRAASARRSLQASVAGVVPIGMPVVVRRQRMSLLTSFVAAAAMVLVFVGIASAMPSFFDPDQVAGSDTSIPDPDGSPILVDPDDKEKEGELVDLDPKPSTVPVRQTNSESDSPAPWTKFYGEAEPGTRVLALSDWGSADLVVDARGEFSLKLWFDPLPPPGTEFPILLKIGDTSYEFHFTSLWDPDNVDITAHQTYGTSDDAEAYEKFFGTATPGLVVSAESPYGSATTTVGETGEWDLKLWFDDLPANDPFDIVVRIAGETFSFGFVSTYEPAAVALSISQGNSTSDSSSPYVRFFGTAPAGTSVAAQSPYGSHSITVGGSGEFSMKLWFTNLPPAGQQFTVAVKVDGSTYGNYPFTSYFAEAAGGGEEDGGGESVSLSVGQYNTESDSPDPWVKFIVNGPVGTQVQIVSSYGSMSRTLESTEEYVKLWFSSLPPAGVEFAVTVKIDGDTWGTYPFTSWYEEPAEEPPIAKTANNTYGSCAEDPPYDIYYGTAPEGTSISISSPYGSGATTADGAGNWSKQVFFEAAPLNEPFTVTVTVGGEVFTFGMVVTG